MQKRLLSILLLENMSEFIALKKAENFAVRITNAHKFLAEVKNERRISDQLYRSGASVMANLAEAQYAASEADYINKVRIALKEANESRQWIELLHKTGYLEDAVYGSILRDINEIIVILIAIVKPRK